MLWKAIQWNLPKILRLVLMDATKMKRKSRGDVNLPDT